MEDLRQHFRPEFLNRLDESGRLPSPREDRACGARSSTSSSRAFRASGSRKSRDLTLDISDEAKDHLAEVGYDPTFGARPLKRAIQRHLENRLAEDILAGRFAAGDEVHVDRALSGELEVRKAETPAGGPEAIRA